MIRRLGRYELVHRLGAGGGGEVWEAVFRGPAGFRRQVAVKLLREGGNHPDAQQGLLQEARLGALVAHPNVVSTLELGEHEGLWFLVMDLVRGQSASALRKRGPLPPGALLDVGVQVCEGLTHIHELCDHDGWPLGLVHRDIKPGNLMIDTTHRVRIVDLGIARLTGTPEVPAGTPGFVAPEQLRGDEGPRADVFALGVTMIYLAIHVLPFGRGDLGLARVLDDDADACATDPGLLERLNTYLPGLGEVLSRAIRVDPDLRWPTASALADALTSLYAACPTSRRLTALEVTAGGEETSGGGMTTERGRFVGRQRELEALEGLLDGDARWMVVVGPGGVGKTRLIDEICREQEVIRCDASKAKTLPGLCHVIAEAVGGVVKGDPVASVGSLLQAKKVGLVVVDELEQVVDAATEAMPAWLAAAPGLRFLCSSRVAPGHELAALVRVGPLSMKDARALFLHRLGAKTPTEVVDPLLRALDRLPLAIELAASRARKTSPERVLAQLRASSSAQVPSLRDALQASWDLLAMPDRRALVQLTSFAGAFDVRDAVAVIDQADRPLERLERLVDHSMLHVRKNRFRLLTSVRAFARAQLPQVREVGDQRHGQWMARFGEPAELRRAYHTSAAARPMIDGIDDLLSASRRAVIQGRAEVAAATTLAACQALHRVGPVQSVEALVERALPLKVRLVELYQSLGRAHYAGGAPAKAEKALQAALARSEGPDRQRVTLNLAGVWFALGKPGAIEHMREALIVLERCGDGRSVVHGRTVLGQLLYMTNEVEEAEQSLRSALEAAERLGHDLGHVRSMLAAVHKRRGGFRSCADMYAQAVAELEGGDEDLVLGVAMVNYSWVLLVLGDLDQAWAMAKRGCDIGHAVGRKTTEGVGWSVMSEVAILRGDLPHALELAGRCLDVASTATDANLQSEAGLAMARVTLLSGRNEQGMLHLERSWEAATRSEAETRAVLASLFGRYASVARAEAVVEFVELESNAADWFPLALSRLARAELAARLGRDSEARGALLQGSAELARLELPEHAPLPRAYARIRSKLARKG